MEQAFKTHILLAQRNALYYRYIRCTLYSMKKGCCPAALGKKSQIFRNFLKADTTIATPPSAAIGEALPVMYLSLRVIGRALPVIYLSLRTIGRALRLMYLPLRMIGRALPARYLPLPIIGKALPIIYPGTSLVFSHSGIPRPCTEAGIL